MAHQSDLLHALQNRVLVCDGAMGTQIQAAEFTPEDFIMRADQHASPAWKAAAERMAGRVQDGCNEILNITRPEAIEQIHANYLAAGADLIETNTFGATSIVLAEYDIPELVYEISLEAAKIARRAADKASTPDWPRFVIGAIGPGTKLVSLGQTTFDEIEDTYCTGFKALLVGGADALMVETTQDLLMVKAVVVGMHRAMEETGIHKPLFVSVTMEQTGTMLLGTEIAAALNMLECFPNVVMIGVNCATGPVEMAPHVRFLSQNSTRPISVMPNAGLPVMEKGQSMYKLTPEELAHHHVHFVKDLGAAMVGGCCGTTPAHIKAVADAVRGLKPSAEAHWLKVNEKGTGGENGSDQPSQLSPHSQFSQSLKLVGCSSLYQFQPYEQDSSFFIVGERTNANGSRAFREMLAAENWDGLVELAREQEGEGSHALDVCAAYVGRNEAKDMRILLGLYNKSLTVPIMIDSTEVDVVEVALKCLAGKPIINSINFEDGETRTEKVLALCRKYGAAVVALTIDEDGMAKTAEKKVEIAERILSRTRANGLPDHDVFLDCLTFTLGSGDEEFRASAVATIEAIREVRRRHPSVNTILGVSNVSFGLKAVSRPVLNSVFLHECRQAGLTAAIVHFSKIVPENKVEQEVWRIAEDLVYDRRQYAEVG
ncbi:MAG: homocysteine S-methyltransferase family protein [Armatimonadetes bacterium]|nr:homocysteine S-methyltransferase family protein [Armatimonadota bacterium]